ncbi:autophagy protein 12 [Gonapodya prolifera JEL478]|uniref:Ubiquitin-like protein ATG12 n=1 Tax=Gonapodya prolifera (strain JEL478) TaxID=1344416 RepID=A0A138ZXU4_GONPJ|nr:autophagy protein 12 [Gonapodya prolifera JEL478]|eukprot:KXS09314.1 autophagy protein 12 [Gonapodya prolifera JEL478]
MSDSPSAPNARTQSAQNTAKVVVHFRPTGNAPILKQNFFKITSSYRFQTVIDFLRKQLNVQPATGEVLLLYVNSAFVPAPDEIVGNLHQCFHDAKGDLVINYATTAAWG